MQITIKIRLRDTCAAPLNKQAKAVNEVWNFCNETQKKAATSLRKWLCSYDLQKLTSGSSKLLDLHAHTITAVCRRYDFSRIAKKKRWLRFRGRRSLGWVPFGPEHVRFDGAAFVFRGLRYEPMHLRNCLKPGMRFCSGSFNADANGHWYINVPVSVDPAEPNVANAVGVDLGLRTLATLSSGAKIEMPRFYRESEAAMTRAQKARKAKKVRAIQAKARRRRKDFLHKASAALCKEYGTIVVGDVSPMKLAKTKMAKSVYDAGWSDLKYMLSYKAIRHGGRMVQVSEAYSSLTCSSCGSTSGPRGLKGLGIREWSCDDCGALHDRDRNGALNILRVGLDTLVAGAPH